MRNRLFGKTPSKSDALLRELFINSPVPTVVTDEHSVIVMVNDAFSDLTLYDAKDVTGEKMSLFKTGRHDHDFYRDLWRKLTKDGIYEGEVWNLCKDQSQKLFLEKIRRITHQAKNYYLCVFEDVTEARKLIERYRYLALHDPLTGLPNRILAKDRFTHALPNTLRRGEQLGVLLCDLNEFKQINDVYGHHIGDIFLQEIAKKLTSLVREGDTVSRFGGDEFLIIVERLKNKQELETLVTKIRKQLQNCMEIDGQIMLSNTSIGAACFPHDAMTYDNLLKIADMNMYEEKNRYYGYL